MKVFVALLLILSIFVSFAVYKLTDQKSPLDVSSPSAVSPNPAKESNTLLSQKIFVFIPYWTFTDSLTGIEEYDQLIYFGVSADENGINTQDEGYTKLATFAKIAPTDKERILTIRMLNSTTNATVIKDSILQDKIIQEAVVVAQKYHFDGILLDFEMNALPLEKVIQRISTFYEKSGKAYQARALKFYVTAYGDNYYRIRPYDMKKIALYADGVIIMAYDFHKANGAAGPNFPLSGKDTYGYDFQQMIQDFTSEVDPAKLSITFGMYGYDWPIGEDGNAKGRGVSLSYNKIQQNFISACLYSECVLTRDTVSAEQRIYYTDQDSLKHMIWFEDQESVEKKKKFLRTKGISSFGFWAYSYF